MQNNDFSNIIVGRNPVLEALRSGREIDKLMFMKGSAPQLAKIIQICKEKKIPVKEVSPQKLEYLSAGAAHQGVAVSVAAHRYSTVDEILESAEEKGEASFIIICDKIEDPHNLGAIIRTAEAVGAHGIIIPERHSATLNATVSKAASGALEYVKIARVTNLAATIDKLKKLNIWIYAADMDGDDWCKTDFSGGCALVIGNEGDGVGRLVKEKCDAVVAMPMRGKINSLNASVAAGILMYEIARQRLNITAFNNFKKG